jgi:RimJ/RimL family protein N-acetyltransferase
MRTAPILDTERLILRSLTLKDAADVQRLAGDYDVASTVPGIPHPYEDGMAEEWIRSCYDRFEKDKALDFAITLRTNSTLIGVIGLKLDRENEKGEIGYWVGKSYWNCGYTTEAARAVVAYGFKVLKLNRIHAYHFKRNAASGRVMEKIGMRYEGCLRQHTKRWDNFEDSMVYGILKADFNPLVSISS